MKLHAIVFAACTILSVLARAQDGTIHIGDLDEDPSRNLTERPSLNTSISGAEALNPYMDEHPAAALWADKGGVIQHESLGCDCKSCDTGCDSCDSCCTTSCGPSWTFIGEALALERRNSSRAPLLIDRNGGGSVSIFTPRNLQMGFEVTPRATVIRHGAFGGKTDLEVSYFQIQNWNSTLVFGGPPNAIVVDRFQFPLNAQGPVQFNYGADMYDGQVNLRRVVNGRLTVLGGFRWIELAEFYEAKDGPNGPNRIAVDTDNHLYGGQFGLDLRAFGQRGAAVNLITKGGVFANFADQSSVLNVNTLAGPGAFPTGNRDFQTSLLWEAKVKGTFSLSNRWLLNFGYQFTWLNGLALAPDQVSTNDVFNFVGGTVVNTGGSVFYHGGFAGLVGTW